MSSGVPAWLNWITWIVFAALLVWLAWATARLHITYRKIVTGQRRVEEILSEASALRDGWLARVDRADQG